ncbi:retinaldehyde-binding protein 1 isoform X2 [Culicoides brevitarsis]
MSNAPFDICTDPPSPAVLEIAKNELRETPEVREQAIKELRELLHEAKELNYGDSDDFLLIFLRPCKFYPKSALELMRRIADFRKTYHDLVYKLMPEDEKAAFCENNVVNILTNRDQKGRRVMIVNAGAIWDPNAVSVDQMFRMFYLIHLLAQLEPESQVNGVVVVMDYENMGLKQVKAMTPGSTKRLITFIQDAMPLRMKEVHMIKQPYVFNMVWSVVKPFLKEKLKNRIFFHGSDMKKLHKYLDPEYLPENYGGKMPKLNYTGKDWFPCVNNYRDHIEKWGTYGYADLS